MLFNGTIADYIGRRYPTPEFQPKHQFALQCIVEDPVNARSGGTVAVNLSKSLIDAIGSFVPANLMEDWITWYLARTIRTSSMRSQNLKEIRQGDEDRMRNGRKGAERRWQIWHQKVEAGEIVPKCKTRRNRADCCIRASVEAKGIYASMAGRNDRRAVLSQFVEKSMAEAKPEFIEKASRHIPMNEINGTVSVLKETHEHLKDFCEKHNLSMTGFIDAVIIENRAAFMFG